VAFSRAPRKATCYVDGGIRRLVLRRFALRLSARREGDYCFRAGAIHRWTAFRRPTL